MEPSCNLYVNHKDKKNESQSSFSIKSPCFANANFNLDYLRSVRANSHVGDCIGSKKTI